MGFRLLNLNPTRRIYMSTKVSSYSPKNSTTYNHSPPQSALIIHVSGPYSFPNSPNPNFNIPKRWHMGHSHHHHDDRDLRTKDGERIFRLGLAADIGLAAGKALTGYISGSAAIIADAAHSLSDVVLSSVALLSFKAARSPKDKEHPYGHGKFETLGALGMSGMLLATAGGIAWHSLDLLLGLWSAAPEIINQSISDDHLGSHHHGLDMEHPILALNMTIVSIAIKEGLYWISKRTAERTGSGLMKVNAWHHRVDAISSVVALIGVGGSILGVKFLDPLAGLVVSGMILKAGLETGYQSVLELVDAAVPLEQLVSFRQAILQVEGVKGCNHLRGRKAGSSLYLDANIEVDPFSSVSAAHEVGENVRCQIQRSHPEVAEVFIHLEPSTSHIPSSIEYQKRNMKEADHKSSSVSSENGDIEELISNILSSKFSERMTVERITRHLLQGKILLQIEVSMPADILIRDAKKIAAEAEKHILSAASNIMQVCIQLRLGHAIPNFNHELQDRNKDKPDYAHVSNPGSN